MAIGDDGVRTPSTEPREVQEFEDPAATARGRGKTRIVLGMLLVLVLLAGAIYLGSRGADTNVATGPGPKQPESSPAATQPLSSDNAGTSTALPPPPQPQSLSPPPSQQSQASWPPPAPAATPAQTPTPETTAQNTLNAPAAQAPTAAQPPMRDHPAALPDQPAAGPKTEAIIVVKRGPANIRAEPGRNGRVIGTAATHEQLKEIGRSGGWVEVETQFGRGFISAALLAPL